MASELFEEMPHAQQSLQKWVPMTLVGILLPRAVGWPIASWIYHCGDTALFDKNMRGVTDAGQEYAYLAAVIFGCLVSWLNAYPMVQKNNIMQSTCDHLRSTTAVLRLSDNKTEATSYAVLASTGPEGQYNRANRSLHQFCESSTGVVITLLLAGFVFPYQVFVVISIFAVGRILHQIGFASMGYGGHALGFVLCALSSSTLEMLCWHVAMKTMPVLTWAS
eukprot:TRINITY_DN38929_c0_g1_i1.p1 TRINITY_DN38929_c0_g1~~TRINITY_DN38929_c0_g1_i1.p1  ORF type:complete len:221 (-),score=28.66 TRINITY_DN38929_c0_g1_i1:84-746(-)